MFDTVSGNPLGAVAARARRLRNSAAEMGPLTLGLVLAQILLSTLAFVGFLVQSIWTPTLVVLFLIASGLGWMLRQATTAKVLTFMMTASTLLTLGLIVVFLVVESIPIVEYAGWGLLAPFGDITWNVSSDEFSLVPMIVGTLLTTAVATLVAAPLGIAGALFISEIAPGWVREIVKPGVEVLAGIPSIVYGFVGFTILNPYVGSLLSVNGGPMVLIGLVIGLMALPTVVSVAEDAITAVPNSMKDGSLAMGATDWQTMKGITLPTAISGVSAAVLLGVGRAIGETMAATVMISHSRRLPEPEVYNAFDSTETLTTLIASSYGNATGDELFFSALFAAGVLLLVVVTGLGIASQLIEMRMERKLRGN